MKSAEWLARQYSRIGGSTAAAALGKSRWQTPRQLWELLTRRRDPAQERISYHMRRGQIYERLALEQFHAQWGGLAGIEEVQPHDQNEFIERPGIYFAHVLPDGWAIRQDGQKEPVQVKAPMPAAWERYARNGLSEELKIEATHTLALIPVAAIHYVFWNPVTVDVLYLRYERDAAACDELMEREREWWERYVVPRIPPPEEAMQTSDGAPPDEGLVLSDEQSIRTAAAYVRLRELREECEEEMERLRAELIASSRDAEQFTVVGVARFLHREQPGRRIIDVDELERRYPVACSDPKVWKSTRPSRPFRCWPLRSGNV